MKETLSKTKDMNYLQKIGTYHLGCMYNLEDFLLMDSVDVFPVNELMPNNKTIPRYLVLSQSNLLNFEIIDKKNNQMKLISWANLQSLLNIKRKKDEQFTLILTWKDAHKSDGLTQIIALEQASKFCELIIRNMKGFGVKISKNIIKQPDLTLDDVTVKAYDQIDIMDLLENITILESRLPEEFTIDIVNTLMMLYQKAVEYYSALNDPAFDDFLEKLHLLLSREDVQILLRSKTEVKNVNAEKTKEKKKVESEDEEEEKKESGAKIDDYFPKPKMNMGISPEKNERRQEDNNKIIKEEQKEIPQEIPKEIIKEIPQEFINEIPKEIHQENHQEINQEINQEIPPEIHQEVHPEIQPEIHQEIQTEIHQEIPQEIHQEIHNEIHQEVHQENINEIVRNDEKVEMVIENQDNLLANDKKESVQNEDLIDMSTQNESNNHESSKQINQDNNEQNNEQSLESLENKDASAMIQEINNNLDLLSENHPENP